MKFEQDHHLTRIERKFTFPWNRTAKNLSLEAFVQFEKVDAEDSKPFGIE